ncbi:transcription initiation factor TFIID subunit A-domain-containing protein, partial [Baffinella frigidus]
MRLARRACAVWARGGGSLGQRRWHRAGSCCCPLFVARRQPADCLHQAWRVQGEPAQRVGASQQSTAAANAATESGVLMKAKVAALVEQVAPGERVDPEVEEVLLEIAEDFVENVTTFACLLAKHRKSNTLEVQDIRLHLEKHWGMRVPGYSGAEERAQKRG